MKIKSISKLQTHSDSGITSEDNATETSDKVEIEKMQKISKSHEEKQYFLALKIQFRNRKLLLSNS